MSLWRRRRGTTLAPSLSSGTPSPSFLQRILRPYQDGTLPPYMHPTVLPSTGALHFVVAVAHGSFASGALSGVAKQTCSVIHAPVAERRDRCLAEVLEGGSLPRHSSVPDVCAHLMKETRRLICTSDEAPPVWEDDDEVKAASALLGLVENNMPSRMCAVCARRRVASVMHNRVWDRVPHIDVLAWDVESTEELPRDGITTCVGPDRKPYCLHPEGE